MLLGLSSVEAAERRLGRKVGDLRDPAAREDDSDAVIGVTSYEVVALMQDQGWPALCFIPPQGNADQAANWYHRVGRKLPAVRALHRIDQHLGAGGVALLGVDSRTKVGGAHWIVAVGHDLFDPTPNRENAYTSMTVDAPVSVHEGVLILGHPEAASSAAAQAAE